MSSQETDDVLERECDRLWFEIRRLLPKHRRLYELGEQRSRRDPYQRIMGWLLPRAGKS